MTTGLDKSFKDVRAFHKAMGHPAPSIPTPQPQKRVVSRAKWINDEVFELLEADGDLVAQADAYLDILYFAVGGMVELGIEPEALWNIVHKANMSKLQPDGSVKRGLDGKIVKPDGWVAPEPLLEAEIQRQIEENSLS